MTPTVFASRDGTIVGKKYRDWWIATTWSTHTHTPGARPDLAKGVRCSVGVGGGGWGSASESALASRPRAMVGGTEGVMFFKKNIHHSRWRAEPVTGGVRWRQNNGMKEDDPASAKGSFYTGVRLYNNNDYCFALRRQPLCVHRDGYTATAPVHVPSFPIACVNTTIIILVYICIRIVYAIVMRVYRVQRYGVPVSRRIIHPVVFPRVEGWGRSDKRKPCPPGKIFLIYLYPLWGWKISLWNLLNPVRYTWENFTRGRGIDFPGTSS